jgi:hypothetical protein
MWSHALRREDRTRGRIPEFEVGVFERRDVVRRPSPIQVPGTKTRVLSQVVLDLRLRSAIKFAVRGIWRRSLGGVVSGFE